MAWPSCDIGPILAALPLGARIAVEVRAQKDFGLRYDAMVFIDGHLAYTVTGCWTVEDLAAALDRALREAGIREWERDG